MSNTLTPKQERTKYVPNAKWIKRPVCWVQGHDRPEDEDGKGGYIYCFRCGMHFASRPLRDFLSRTRYRAASATLRLANFIDNPRGRDFPTNPGHYPRFRPIDTKTLMHLGTKHSCDAYSYEGLKSLVEQYKNDGLPDVTVAHLISEDGWIEINDDNAGEITKLINESFTEEANRQERKRTMELMAKGEQPK